MKLKLYLFTVALLSIHTIFAQESDTNFFYHHKGSFTPSPSGNISINGVTSTSGTGSNINVKANKIWWRINPDSNLYIKGNVQTNFLTTQSAVTSISFDLNSVFLVDSVRFRGAKLAAGNITRIGHILNIDLGATLANNYYDSITVYYRGVPPLPPAGSGPQGFKKQATSVGALNYMMSVAESYEDRDWWPCKADMADKIDTLEMKVNVPWASPNPADTFWAVGNGVLIDSTISGTSRTFTYRSTYPIASYLVGVSVGRFNHYYRSVNINGTNVPVIYNLLAGNTAATYNGWVTSLDKMNLVINAFSQKFGDYPFKKEKHSYYDGLTGAGGIEHQTGACIQTGSLNNLQTLAHELMHQWFGDNVTFATWNDLWLAEGFARHSESLVAELVPSLGLNPYTIRNSIKTSALGLNAQSTWIPNSNSTTSALIWGTNYGSTVYSRGAMVASMLRSMCGDSKYFQALTNYQTNRAGNSANTDTLKNYFNEVLGVDISAFFDDYVGGSGTGAIKGGIGNPVNTVIWNTPLPNKLMMRMGTQTKSAGSNVGYFQGPVVVHATNAATGWTKDTTIVFYDGQGLLSKAGNGITLGTADFVSYDLSFTPTNLFYDDSARTLSTGSTSKLTTLGVKILSFTAQKQSGSNTIHLSIVNDALTQKVILLKSTDGINFTAIGDMIENNNSLQDRSYLYTDAATPATTVYYQAKIISRNDADLSQVVKINADIIRAVSITPNPAAKFVNINLININKEKIIIKLINTDGQTVLQTSTVNNQIMIDAGNLPTGMYTVQMLQNEEVLETKKILIQR